MRLRRHAGECALVLVVVALGCARRRPQPPTTGVDPAEQRGPRSSAASAIRRTPNRSSRRRSRSASASCPRHPEIGRTLSNLGLVRSDAGTGRGRGDAPARERRLPSTHPDVGRSLVAVASAVGCDPGRYAEAEPYYTRAIAVWEHALGPEHPHLALGLGDWAASAARAGRLGVAERLYARALRIQEARLPPEHPSLAATRRSWADVRASRRAAGTDAGEPAP